MFFAANNSYATPTSIGFANTWFVLAFEDKASRDAYVAGSDDLAARAITRKEVTGYAKGWDNQRNCEIVPRPFSGEFWGINAEAGPVYLPAGCLGQVIVADPYNWISGTIRLNK